MHGTYATVDDYYEMIYARDFDGVGVGFSAEALLQDVARHMAQRAREEVVGKRECNHAISTCKRIGCGLLRIILVNDARYSACACVIFIRAGLAR